MNTRKWQSKTQVFSNKIHQLFQQQKVLEVVWTSRIPKAEAWTEINHIRRSFCILTLAISTKRHIPTQKDLSETQIEEKTAAAATVKNSKMFRLLSHFKILEALQPWNNTKSQRAPPNSLASQLPPEYIVNQKTIRKSTCPNAKQTKANHPNAHPVARVAAEAIMKPDKRLTAKTGAQTSELSKAESAALEKNKHLLLSTKMNSSCTKLQAPYTRQ